jgi:hypothetical protein
VTEGAGKELLTGKRRKGVNKARSEAVIRLGYDSIQSSIVLIIFAAVMMEGSRLHHSSA